jgi:hypothetical protein
MNSGVQVMTVAPHPRFGWNIMRVRNSTDTAGVIDIPRFGVSCNRVGKPYGDRVYVTDCAEWIVFKKGADKPAFRVEPKHADVMGLKKAIKLEAELAGPAHLLVIRKAGGEEELDAEAALEPGVKYSYEVPK